MATVPKANFSSQDDKSKADPAQPDEKPDAKTTDPLCIDAGYSDDDADERGWIRHNFPRNEKGEQEYSVVPVAHYESWRKKNDL